MLLGCSDGLVNTATHWRRNWNQKIWLIQSRFSRKCKFNYLFVHVSRPKVRLHNLNGNREAIYLFTYLFFLQIQAAMLEMKLTNKSQLPNDCGPIITVSSK